MLRSFRLQNHRSFRGEAELSLLPSYQTDRSAVPVAAIYGANAAGKSSLLDGLRFMSRAVVESYRRWEPEGGVPRRPFRLDPASLTNPSMFVVDLVVEGIRYLYGFAVDDDRVLEEWLYGYPRGKKRVIFERQDSSVEFGSTVSEPRSRSEVLAELTRPNALFLSLAAQVGMVELTPVREWFVSGLRWGSSRSGLLPPCSAPFDFVDESAGTQAWISLLPSVLRTLRQASTLVIDEIDTSLHPHLTAHLVRMFQSEQTNPGGAQLIFTTHDASLLGTTFGEEVLARDQVWFVEKDADGSSSLYPLTDFHPRKDENRERRYLGGSYGAVPVLGVLASASRQKHATPPLARSDRA